MARLFFVFLGLASIVGASLMSTSLGALVHVPSLLIVLIPSFALTCASHGYAGLIDALKAGMAADPRAEPRGQQHSVTLQTLRNTLCGAGAVGSLVGFISMLENMSNPSRLGPAVATALISCLYAIGFAELLVAPMIQRFKGSGPADSNASSDGPRGAVTAAAAVLVNSGLLFAIWFSFAPYA